MWYSVPVRYLLDHRGISDIMERTEDIKQEGGWWGVYSPEASGACVTSSLAEH